MANNFVPSIVAAALNARSIYNFVYDRSGGYNTLSMLTDKANKNGSRRVTNADGKYEKYKRGKTNIVASVATVTQSGNNLVLTFVDPTYDKFLLGDVVQDPNYVQGRIIAAAPGTITIAPYPGTTALDATTQFQVATLCIFLFDASGTYGSTGKGNRFFLPQQYINYPSNTRESVTLTRADKVETYVTESGSKFAYVQAEVDCMNRFFKSMEFKYWFSQYGAPTASTYQGSVTGNRGLRQSIVTDGVYMPMASAPTADNLRDMLSQLGNRNTMSGQRFTGLIGRDALINIQNTMTQPYIQFAGSRNTFGGEAVEGLNVMMYAIGDVRLDLIVAPILNDQDLSSPTSAPGATGTKLSNSIYIVNFDDVPALGGGGMCPAIEKFHFGDKEILRKAVTGMTGPMTDDTGMGSLDGFDLTASDVDGYSVHFEANTGIDVEGYRCGLIELTT